MRVGAMSVAGAAVLAATGLVAVPSGVAVAVTGCSPTSVFDVNGDGVGDAAIGASLENVGKVKDAGSVTIVYGSSTGRTFDGSASSKLVTQETFGGASETNDRFGESIAIGDLNKDGCKDLVIGVPGENKAAGRVQVAFGSPTGMSFAQRQSISQNSAGVPGGAEVGDEFGAAVAVQGSGTSTWLWVGAPGENLGSATGAGTVVRIPAGTGSRLATSGIAGYSQGSGAVPGGAETGDRFGTVISATAHSVLIGVPREDVSKLADAGVVYAFTGTWKVLTQDTPTPDVPGGAEAGDRFGASVAQVPSCTGNAADEAYVIGAPNENIGATADAGSVSVVDVPSGGAVNVQQDAAEAGDLFGLRVATAGHLLVAAAPEEDLGGAKNAGLLYQAFLGCSGTAPAVSSSSDLSLDTPLVPGTPASGDRLGLGLGFAWITDGDALGQVLLVGAPLKADGSVLDSGRVTVLSNRSGDLLDGTGSKAFGQSSTGIVGDAETNDQFGASIGTNSY